MIADAAHVRTVGNLPEAVSSGMLSPHLRMARTRLKQWVGGENYTTAETEVSTARESIGELSADDISALSEMAQALIDAEAFLALNSGLPAFNMVMNDDAGIASEGEQGETTFKFLTPRQVQDMQKIYLRNAELSAKEYIVAAPFGIGVSNAYDDEGEAID